MRIIIPMAGIGSRLKPHTLTVPKPLTKIAGKSIVERLLEEIVQVVGQKVTDIAFIIGPKSKGFPEDIEEQLSDIAVSLNSKAHIFVQEEALGTAHAIHQATDVLEGPCVIAFADTLFKADFTLDDNADGVIWVKKIPNPEQFGVVKLQDGYITDFVEKPDTFVSDLAIIGIYYFKEGEKLKQEIKYLIDNDIRGKGGEYQITDALENLKLKGAKLVPGTVDDWMDCGNKDETVITHHKVLDYEEADGKNLRSQKISLENSKIIPPCYIADGVVIKDSTVGPHVSLGKNTQVTNSIIKDSLIQDDTLIANAQLEKAMIGSHVIFDGKFKSVSLGDYSSLI